MEVEECSNKLTTISKSLIDVVFSWGLDVLNEELFKTQVKEIPLLFQSKDHYFESFEYPLLEETRASLSSNLRAISRAPFAGVTSCKRSVLHGGSTFDVKVDHWRSNKGNTTYKVSPGDLFAITDAIGEEVSCSDVEGRTWIFASVVSVDEANEDKDNSFSFAVKASSDLESNCLEKNPLSVVFLANIATHERIWNALHVHGNMEIIKQVLHPEVEQKGSLFSEKRTCCSAEELDMTLLSKLDKPQTNAVLASLCNLQCNLKPSVELILGPPGTGKTDTLSNMLLILSRMESRALVCAHSSVAIKRLAIHFLELAKVSYKAESDKCSLSSLDNFLFFGDDDQLEDVSEMEAIHLDCRATRLLEAFKPLKDWRDSFTSMIDLLENCVSQYTLRQNNEGSEESKSFAEFVIDSFISIAIPLRSFISSFCSHFPRNFMTGHIFEAMHKLVNVLGSFESLLFENNATSEDLLRLFSHPKEIETALWERHHCLSLLKDLLRGLDKLLPSVINKITIKELCIRVAVLIFCTASSSYKLHSADMKPLNLLIVDEAQQLKECEFLIPLQLPGLQHAILCGDLCQLPASIASKVSAGAGFGRSLFERLSLNGHLKHLLSMQYRMHPAISLFPRSKFYDNLISDAPKVRKRSYSKSYLPGPLFGSYSFINISCGKEEKDGDRYTGKNMIEVAVVTKILQNLYKAWKGLRQQISIAVTSPYTAQVVEIRDKLGRKYKSFDGSIVKVVEIDELQGKEVDIVIFSTVGSNSDGSAGLLSDNQRVNVALTRARHCLWILGNEETLTKYDSLWKSIVHDAKDRNCFFNVEEDNDVAKLALEVKEELDQLDELVDADSFLFRNSKWKVHFSENFRESFGKIESSQMKKLVMDLLRRLSTGWRPKRRNVDIICDESRQILKQFKVKDLNVICSIDIVKECRYIQVLRVWDLLPLVDVPNLVGRLDSVFLTYTDDFLNHCKAKCLDGDLEIPMSWEPGCNDFVCHEKSGFTQEGINLSAEASNETSRPREFEASDSLLLMKFYSLSSPMPMVSHLLTGCDGTEMELPFELTSQEMKIVDFDRSAFVLGRSGTGKTTVLIRKLFEREQSYHLASEGFHELDGCNSKHERTENGEGAKETNESFLRQVFVTLNPRLCNAVKENVSGLKRFASGGKISEDCTSIHQDDISDTSWFGDIPDSFVGLSPRHFPLAITLHKFLMMLDGTVGNSFFDRFPQARCHSHATTRDKKSMALKTFIRMREVTFQKFDLSYWPHFDVKSTNNLKASVVFVEIMSHIKGGLHGGDVHEKLSRKDYLSQSESRMSRLNMQERERIYDIFLQYEKKKMENGEYDMADLVIDLHRRFRDRGYEGDKFDFVYIDEVQDLTIGQIALFKYICRNVDDGFFFSGDTAQTIAKGVDFRFEDIRCLFYKEFVMKSRNESIHGKEEKGVVSDTFHLSQNFRTHAGILKLAQSVTNLICYFFPQSIDILHAETSRIKGETPVLIESLNGNALISMFSNADEGGKSLIGFGAEQVILVRDDKIRSEVLSFVGKNALILTISECKGLEFQDVLLYNFLSSSPLENQWRVIYKYMKDKNILNNESPTSFPSFNEAKHILLCSELKQLYVAITRTKQRLWVFENADELSQPMFDYWKQLQTVEVQGLDDLFAREIQVSSSKRKWKLRGIQLFSERNYEAAKMCFEKAGEAFFIKWAEAAGLRDAAWNISCSNSGMAHIHLKKAAEIFNSIQKFEEAAQCFYESEEFALAGEIYQEKCCDSKLEEAGECFLRAGLYDRAATAYARGNFFSNCLAACIDGKLFDMGLNYIQNWKEHATLHNVMERNKHQLKAKEQELLSNAAIHYKKLGDSITMMKFVKSFHSNNSMRVFLKTEGCLDELLQLENEWGSFQNAANVAKQMGKTLLEAELLEKAGCYKEASMTILFYAFASSLWTPGSVGWPLKQFTGKRELLDKAKSLAKNVSSCFFNLVCLEEHLLSNTNSSLHLLQKQFRDSKKHQSVRGKIICARKILEAHFSFGSSKYMWPTDLVKDPKLHAAGVLSKNQASVETLVFFWGVWKKNIGKIFKFLESLKSDDAYGEFCLNYLGVTRTKSFSNDENIYLLLNADACWVKQINDQYLRHMGTSVRCKTKQFVHAARCYWSSEMLLVGTKVLEQLSALCEFSRQNSLPLHLQIVPVLHMFVVAKSLIEAKFLHHKYNDRTLHRYLEAAMSIFVGNAFPVDWRKLVTLNMTNLRETENFKHFLEGMIPDYTYLERPLLNGKIGNVVMMIVGICGGLRKEVYRQVSQRFVSSSFWRTFIGSFENIESGFVNVSLVQNFHKALKLIYYADCVGEADSISPGCFMYLVERVLTLIFYLKGCFFSTKSSLLEWLINQKSNTNAILNSEAEWRQQFIGALDIVAAIVAELLYNQKDVNIWIENSKLSPDCHPVLVLRLFVSVCLLCVNSGKYYDLLFELRGRKGITSLLPLEFRKTIRKLKPGNHVEYNVKVLACAFKQIDNPLVVVCSGRRCIKCQVPDAIYVDLQDNREREELIGLMFKESSGRRCIDCQIPDAIFVDLQDNREREELIGIMFKESSGIHISHVTDKTHVYNS